ncbi:MAG: ribonuclease HII [Armatimonadetes bacterium]|nr:ribonuclease HII [Armatimonadota bacterium]
MIRFTETSCTLIATPGIAGVDEAGRGPLAGPVVAAAVLLPESFELEGIQDSKKLTRQQRAEQYQRIVNHAEFAWHAVDSQTIDEINILEATMVAMRTSVEALGIHIKEAFVDGNRIPAGSRVRMHPVVKGDGLYAAVAAASIIAKQQRDDLMLEYAVQYPKYGFQHHFGYPTPEHLDALRKYGPCPIHRRSFAPVRVLVEEPALLVV